MLGLTTRPATLADLDTLVGMFMDLGRHHEPLGDYWRLSADAVAAWRAHLADTLEKGESLLLLAETRGRPAGCLLASVRSRPPMFRCDREAVIENCYVNPACRRQGVGTRLVQAAKRWAKEQDVPLRAGWVLANKEGSAFWPTQGFAVEFQTGLWRDEAAAVPAGGHADYAAIAPVYDRVRTDDKPHVAWWRQRLIEVGGLGPGKVLLDLGCGTGRWTIPLVEQSGCRAVGVDSSAEMLDQARAKEATCHIEWRLGDIYSPPVPAASCDAALMSLMLHHMADITRAFRAALACLRPGGVLLVRQGTLENVADDPIRRFFPGALAADRRRTPLRLEVERALAEAGFEQVAAEVVRRPTRHSGDDWLREAELRVASIFHLLPEADYQRGLARLKQYVAGHPDDPWLLVDEMTLFSARRPI